MVSVDTLEDNTAFAKKENADFPILADPTKETARKYGVLADYSKFMLGEVANRWTFYIGPDGKILAVDKGATGRGVGVKTAGDDAIKKLEELGIKKKK